MIIPEAVRYPHYRNVLGIKQNSLKEQQSKIRSKSGKANEHPVGIISL